ncbi:hypothetical protein VC83_00347 [Pseudogymnoascus destructans]|uniref:Retrotransposon Copia-like N-terminal domain-containing protein n=2 Tax=Pseudogymnoascus destructans TaxID=655981 RepID=L8G7D5_PSED2|nr:uncharacterized protein VC83_00347 [Pseudogymnoascus destructans]ELR08779.1 hypothetical protein GMDG_03457 [Pseudogymnoascus destructans 20631-21]OAF63463.1 hypothetical protein VC83_00347 [Pseudogymnoascus destructans]
MHKLKPATNDFWIFALSPLVVVFSLEALMSGSMQDTGATIQKKKRGHISDLEEVSRSIREATVGAISESFEQNYRHKRQRVKKPVVVSSESSFSSSEEESENRLLPAGANTRSQTSRKLNAIITSGLIGARDNTQKTDAKSQELDHTISLELEPIATPPTSTSTMSNYYTPPATGNGTSFVPIQKDCMLNGDDNYKDWSKRMINALQIERLWDLVDGYETEPEKPDPNQSGRDLVVYLHPASLRFR